MFRKLSLIFLLVVLLASPAIASPSAGQAPDSESQSEGNWTLLDAPTAPGGIVDDLVEAPGSAGMLYALIQGRNGERLFRSTDASEASLTWQQVYTFTAQVGHLSVAHAISTTLFAGGQDGAFRSINGGLSWTQVYTLGEALAVAPNDLVFAAGKISAGDSCNTYGVARSSNNGDDWQATLLDCIGGITHLAIDPTNSETIYAAGYITETLPGSGWPVSVVRLWRSQDGGETFTTLLDDGVPPYGIPVDLVVDPQSPGRLYLSTYEIMISDDYGDSWQAVGDLPYHAYKLMANGDALYAIQTDTYGSEAEVYRSQDQGRTWWQAARDLPNQANAITAHPDQPGRIYVGMVGFGIFRSDTQGGDWQEHNTGIQSPAGISSLAVAQSDPNTIYAGSKSPRGGLFASHDGGLTWQYILADIKVFTVAVSPSDASLVFVGDMDGLLRSENGQDWSRIYYADPVFSISLPHAGSEGLYIAGNSRYVPRGYAARFLGFFDGDWHWTSEQVGDADHASKVLLDPYHPGRVYVGAMTYQHGGAIYKREAGQNDWQAVLENAGGYVVDLLIDPRHSATMYAGVDEGVYVSQDGGMTWTLRDSGFPEYPATTRLALDELGTLYTGTYYTGVYRWDSAQAQWIQDGLADQPVEALVFWPGNPPALLAGNAAGLWKRDLPIAQHIWMPAIIR